MNKNEELQNKKQAIVLTPAYQKLLEFLNPQELPSLLADFKQVFVQAAFFGNHDWSEEECMPLYMQHCFIELLYEMEKENMLKQYMKSPVEE